MSQPRAPSWLTALPIAHRGLHDADNGCPENSLSAFRAAIEHGYGIECDLQIAADGAAMVFHDGDLKRMTGDPRHVRDMESAALGEIMLVGSHEPVARLETHLELVAGRVPLVLELKGIEGHEAGLVEAVADALHAYEGPVAVMSFSHAFCSAFADALPDIPRGLTAMGDETTHERHRQAMADYDLQYVSYHVDALPNAFVDDMRATGHSAITWTVRNQEQVQRTFAHADQMTFEGFLPPVEIAKPAPGKRANG